MKPRHAAALALVGWYLMVPPIQNGRPNDQAPFSKWVIEHIYDSADRCDYVMRKLRPRIICECIASDDPRLKGN